MRLKIIFSICFGIALSQVGLSQIGISSDVEYTSTCMVDSLPSGEAFRFQRLFSVTTLEVIDVDPMTGNRYTPAGTLITCSDYDLSISPVDPLEELYPDCQCSFTISQESHEVVEIRGDTFQDFTVQFEEVVSRKCGEQMEGTEVYRDTLAAIGDLSNMTMSFGWTFTQPGQIVNTVNLRLYRTSGVPSQVAIVLDPDLVETIYPGLSIDTSDLRYNGSNAPAMATAFAAVAQYAIEQVDGPTVNLISSISSDSSVFLRTELLHQPNYPYVTQPRPDDPDYFQSSTIPGSPVALAVSGKSLSTSTSFWSDQCSPIRTLESGSYITYDRATPLDLQPILDVETSIFTASSTPTIFCDADPAFCAEFAPGNVTVMGCVELCNDTLIVDLVKDTVLVEIAVDSCLVQNIPEIEDVTGASVFPGDFYHSISITVVSGTLDLTIGSGATITLPSGYDATWQAPNECDLLSQVFTLNPSSSGRAIVNTLR